MESYLFPLLEEEIGELTAILLTLSDKAFMRSSFG